MDGFINLNKPVGLTSFDCVAKLRKLLSTKKIGHAGTLDPDAVGVLPIAVGKATRLLEYVTAVSKQYRAVMTIGIKTTTQDASGEVIERISSSHLTRSDIINILPKFEGAIEQIPPMFSAIKINGKKLYELARQNIEIDRTPRQVTIHEIKLLDFTPGEFPQATLDIVCSKGTYIRTLLQDIGEKLSTTAHMSFLERTGVGEFTIDKTFSLEDIASQMHNRELNFLLDMDYPLKNLGEIIVNDNFMKRILHGNSISIENAEQITHNSDNLYRVYGAAKLIAIAHIEGSQIKVHKVLHAEGETK